MSRTKMREALAFIKCRIAGAHLECICEKERKEEKERDIDREKRENEEEEDTYLRMGMKSESRCSSTGLERKETFAIKCEKKLLQAFT